MAFSLMMALRSRSDVVVSMALRIYQQSANVKHSNAN
jgi:hypothetical protein